MKVTARAIAAANELAAAIRAMQTDGLSVHEMREIVGMERETLLRLMSDWGLDR